ncbi:MAG: hypothetical protein WC961_07675 [Anaerovoracaceae bacterium]|jgi:hypothetical protein
MERDSSNKSVGKLYIGTFEDREKFVSLFDKELDKHFLYLHSFEWLYNDKKELIFRCFIKYPCSAPVYLGLIWGFLKSEDIKDQLEIIIKDAIFQLMCYRGRKYERLCD